MIQKNQSYGFKFFDRVIFNFVLSFVIIIINFPQSYVHIKSWIIDGLGQKCLFAFKKGAYSTNLDSHFSLLLGWYASLGWTSFHKYSMLEIRALLIRTLSRSVLNTFSEQNHWEYITLLHYWSWIFVQCIHIDTERISWFTIYCQHVAKQEYDYMVQYVGTKIWCCPALHGSYWG